MFIFMQNLARREDGTTAIEYGLIAALIVVVIVGAIAALGNGVSNTLYAGISNLF
jgi:pilus assembly protein Flp/PilA